MVLPSEKYLAEMLDQVDVHQLRSVRDILRLKIAQHNELLILKHYQGCLTDSEYSIDADSVASRGLKNTCLVYLMQLQKPEYFQYCQQQYESANNMTDQMGCLQAIVHHEHPLRDEILGQFYHQWKETPLVLDKWFSVIGSSNLEQALDTIRPLFEHPDYSLGNPNRARSLLGSMIANSRAFHQIDGAGYQFAAQKVLELDTINPQVAARLANPFVHWRKLVTAQGLMLRAQIESMLGSGELSNDLNELLSTSLKE
jgi:aminopeptidase N